ncbi:hypothetical protein JYU34_004396 [Plutella xylostella]|uniref:FLYWCH-type domain-containing protein n=1 Tax=Plutella xylostella TaxID=51655 RepID=A0ABQ7QXX1_PLUXY|nr:hypothetical protein JYU34_004396 [Plutella xylostella]
MDNFTYCVRKYNDNDFKKYWYCSTHSSKGCRARVITIDNKVVCMIGHHTHDGASTIKVNLKIQ